MKAAGFDIMGHTDCPICPVLIGDAHKGAQMSEELMKKDIYVISFSFPVVAKGKARIRCQVSGAHSEEDIDMTIKAFSDVGKKMGII
jgi:glycine C-acetyltransferase